jgi:peptide/nickel transport system permease protein
MLGGFTLVILYCVAAFAGFFSPYSPTTDEFRSLFFHPPTKLSFYDENGTFHFRPYVFKSYLSDQRSMTYSYGSPLRILYRYPAGNLNRYFPDSIEQSTPILTIRNEQGIVVATATSLRETTENSSVFTAIVGIDPALAQKSQKIIIQDAIGNVAEFPIFKSANVAPQNQNNAGDSVFLLQDENGRTVSGYHYFVTRSPIRFFVRSWRYKILGLFHSDLHLFGTPEPGHVFLFGTDQVGRDIFSRVLFGAQISLTVGIVGVLLTTVLGLILGGIAGYYGGASDHTIMRFTEVLISIPALYLILSIRNIIPDRMEDLYEKLMGLGQETFAWQNDRMVFAIVIIIVVLLLSYYNYRKRWNKARFIWSGLLLFGLIFGPAIVELSISILRWILPGSTHVTSEWSYVMVIVILSMVGWAAMARVIRGMVLSLKEEEYVLAARAAGASDARIIFRHILPNKFGYVIVRASLLIPAYILAEVALSFLGLGVQEPIPSWGNMLAAAQNLHVLQQFVWTLAPGFFIFITVLAFNFLGDGLRDALDPRLKV